ncbi:hypothetical protein K040078D81_42220 [Blautia hominis]|uniref:Uncharacterized protein n=1 Tax=Blautia hominis TaxID=2025493 RepID=A0ABQ0BF62_9FIRM
MYNLLTILESYMAEERKTHEEKETMASGGHSRRYHGSSAVCVRTGQDQPGYKVSPGGHNENRV